MLSRFVLPSTAILGFGFALFTIASGSRPPIIAPPVAEPARASFARYIAGAGIVEPSSQAIAIGSPLARCVATVSARVGQEVEAGAPLFALDDRDLRAELSVRRTALATAEAKLARLHALPRAEDLPPARARVAETAAQHADAANQLALAESVGESGAISREDLVRRRHEAEAAAARLERARAELVLLEAGAWRGDLEVAESERAAAQAQVQATETELERLVVRAPIAGQVLQVNVRAGEFASAGELATPLVLLGAVHPLFVRVDIDENDAWRFQEGAAATASVRGNRDIRTALEFEYLEPYVVPKRSLTGDTAERVDTRVMQALFRFERGDLPIRVGQQMDVFIEVRDPQPAATTAMVKQ